MRLDELGIECYNSMKQFPRRGEININILTPDKTDNAQALRDLQQRKRPMLFNELQIQLARLDQITQYDLNEAHDPSSNDETLIKLQMIASEAVRVELWQIEKLCKLAIGKRILNIQLRKRRQQHQAKLLNKEKIQLFFRQNRIKRYDYQQLISDKLNQNTLIVRPYQNGKGFLQSDRDYRHNYGRALQMCRFMQTIKHVNKIFYGNYSSITKAPLTLAQKLLKFLTLPIILFVCLSVIMPFISFPYEQVIIMGLLGIILCILLFVSVRTFQDKPNHNNQIQQSTADVREYFMELNQRNYQAGNNIQWSCSNDFMFLEVAFRDGLPT